VKLPNRLNKKYNFKVCKYIKKQKRLIKSHDIAISA